MNRNISAVAAAAARRSWSVAGEQHHHRVAAELEHVAATSEDRGDQAAEHGVEDIVDVLGTAASESGQTFGQLREPGDVEEGE